MLTDIGLPKIAGLQLFHELRAVQPSVKVVFCTGFVEDAKQAELLATGALAIIQKPYRVGEVLRVIQGALDKVLET